MTTPEDWTAAQEEAYAYASTSGYTIAALELIHPQFIDGDSNQDSIRIALDGREWDLEHEDTAPLFAGETKRYQPLALRVTPPEQGESGLGNLQMTIDNVPRTVWPMLQNAAKVRASARVIYREWIAMRDESTGAFVVSGPPDMINKQLTMKVVRATQLQLSGMAGFVDLLNKKFPKRTFDRAHWPGLHGVNQ